MGYWSLYKRFIIFILQGFVVLRGILLVYEFAVVFTTTIIIIVVVAVIILVNCDAIEIVIINYVIIVAVVGLSIADCQI